VHARYRINQTATVKRPREAAIIGRCSIEDYTPSIIALARMMASRALSAIDKFPPARLTAAL
jgi:hypothetical protein